MNIIPRLKKRYKEEIVPVMMKKFSYKNTMQVPKFKNIVINVGLGEAIENVKLLDSAVDEIAAITGQKPIITRSKKSISNFKLREGASIGCKVTLRGNVMYEFLDRLISVAMPRIRDFKGVSPKSFDGRGNYSLGIKEQLIFPEIDHEKIQLAHGMDITFVVSSKNDSESKELLEQFGFRFR